MRVQPAGRLGHVHHEVGTALELVTDAHHRHEEPQVGRDRLLAREQQEHAVFDRVGQVVDGIVVLDDGVGGREVAVEQRLRAAGDLLGGEGGEADHVDAELVEVLVKALARLGGETLGVLRLGARSGGESPPCREEGKVSSSLVYPSAMFGQLARNATKISWARQRRSVWGRDSPRTGPHTSASVLGISVASFGCARRWPRSRPVGRW